jgi:2-polyprenyl-3-methyl-5-hydroxy-6-metoxy-1,4-benzoquinol methylase
VQHPKHRWQPPRLAFPDPCPTLFAKASTLAILAPPRPGMNSMKNHVDDERRSCPFCLGADASAFGTRFGAQFVRCAQCSAIYMNISPAMYERLHEGNYEDQAYVADITAAIGSEPYRRAWSEFAEVLQPGSVLEIGPGSGHVLAAARDDGRDVTAVEASAAHRDFIRTHWGIDQVFTTLSELPAERRYDNVIMVNMLEHVYDVVGLMRELRAHLSPGARVFISTVNGQGILGTLAGTYWAMFKPRDHVSFPSLASLAQLADLAGYRVDRSWSGEQPLETPIGLLVAARDFVRERRAKTPAASSLRMETPSEQPSTNAAARARKKRLLALVYRATSSIDLTRRVTGIAGRAATVKGVLVPR